MLTWYDFLRLSEAAGLVPNDIDLGTRLIHVRDNELRRIKTKSSKRGLPVYPELERLGFLDLVKRRQLEGAKQLFPGLFGRKSDFAAVFQKS